MAVLYQQQTEKEKGPYMQAILDAHAPKDKSFSVGKRVDTRCFSAHHKSEILDRPLTVAR